MADSAASVADLQNDLHRLERRVARISVPLSYADELYALRSHIQLVRDKLAQG